MFIIVVNVIFQYRLELVFVVVEVVFFYPGLKSAVLDKCIEVEQLRFFVLGPTSIRPAANP